MHHFVLAHGLAECAAPASGGPVSEIEMCRLSGAAGVVGPPDVNSYGIGAADYGREWAQVKASTRKWKGAAWEKV